MLSSDELIVCFLSLYIARDAESFDKRIKPGELRVLFLSEIQERNTALSLIFKRITNYQIPS